jgi:hypothetical protein
MIGPPVKLISVEKTSERKGRVVLDIGPFHKQETFDVEVRRRSLSEVIEASTEFWNAANMLLVWPKEFHDMMTEIRDALLK